jgi:hypothetical protein
VVYVTSYSIKYAQSFGRVAASAVMSARGGRLITERNQAMSPRSNTPAQPPTENDSLMTVGSPLYLVRSFAECWKCQKEQSVIAIATRRIRTSDFDQLGADGSVEPVFLTNIEAMPPAIVQYLAAVQPQFQKRRSKTMEMDYYANTCKDCGENFGDWFLFSEPEGAFFPMGAEQCKRISVAVMPFEGVFEFTCSYGGGTGEFIFAHAARVDR